MATVRYLTHPQVAIDPNQEIGLWGLHQTGHMRVAGLIASGLGVFAQTTRVISSAETKAVETAAPIADALDLPLEIRSAMHENDRSATGFLPSEAFEETANQFFAQPDVSVKGWETAKAAQTRILADLNAVLTAPSAGDILVVGHGAVGTLLWCALQGCPIDRSHDQGPGGGGNWFAFETTTRKPGSGWQPMENIT